MQLLMKLIIAWLFIGTIRLAVEDVLYRIMARMFGMKWEGVYPNLKTLFALIINWPYATIKWLESIRYAYKKWSHKP